MQCPKCHKETAIKHPIYGILPGEKCRAKDRSIAKATIQKPPLFLTQTMADRITAQQDRHAKDIIQPWDHRGDPNPDFVKNYKEQATEYFTQEQLEKL